MAFLSSGVLLYPWWCIIPNSLRVAAYMGTSGDIIVVVVVPLFQVTEENHLESQVV